MACMGPDLDFYKRESKKALADVIELLRKKYQIDTIQDLENRVNSGYKPARRHIQFVRENNSSLEKLLEEIFVQQGCIDF